MGVDTFPCTFVMFFLSLLYMRCAAVPPQHAHKQNRLGFHQEKVNLRISIRKTGKKLSTKERHLYRLWKNIQ